MFTTETLKFFILNIKTGEFNVPYFLSGKQGGTFHFTYFCLFSFSMERWPRVGGLVKIKIALVNFLNGLICVWVLFYVIGQAIFDQGTWLFRFNCPSTHRQPNFRSAILRKAELRNKFWNFNSNEVALPLPSKSLFSLVWRGELIPVDLKWIPGSPCLFLLLYVEECSIHFFMYNVCLHLACPSFCAKWFMLNPI